MNFRLILVLIVLLINSVLVYSLPVGGGGGVGHQLFKRSAHACDGHPAGLHNANLSDDEPA